MASWLDIERGLEAAAQRIFAERVVIEPMKRGRYVAGAADPERAVYDGPAILRLEDSYAAAVGGVDISVNYHGARLEIERSALAEGWDFRKDDLVTAAERDGAPQYYVTRVDALAEVGFVVLTLTPIGERDA